MHLQNYLEWKKSYTRPTSYPNYERWVLRFDGVADKEKGDYTIEDISKFREFLKEKGYSPKNIQYGLSIIRDYLSYCMNMHGLKFPMSLFRIKQERSKSHHAVTVEEFERMNVLLPESDPISLQRKVMLNLLYETGVRGGELLSLKLEDVDYRKAVVRNEKNHRNRLVAWSENTQRLLVKYLDLRIGLKTNEPWVFVSFKWVPRNKLTTRQLERIMADLRKEAGLTTIVRPHSFRHGFVHRKLASGTPITTVSQMLGHSSTMNVINYAQLSSKEINEAWGIA